MRDADRRLGLLDVLEGYYAGVTALVLLRAGVLDALKSPRSAKALARDLGLAPDRLRELLDFVSRTTTLIDAEGREGYKAGPISPAELTFQLEKFIGSYGISLHGLGAILSGARRGTPPDEAALTTAFRAVSQMPSPAIGLLRKMRCRRLLDLGCGTGSLLIALAQADPGFRGVGIDDSRTMSKCARSAVREAGLSRRIRVIASDARDIRRVLDAETRRSIDAVHGRSLLNAFFRQGPKDAIAFLRKLRRAFPKRAAVFVDYYGTLGDPNRRRPQHLGMLQDMAQIASGQGVPAFDEQTWRSIYCQAGCDLHRAHDYRSDGIRWFVHEVRFR